MERARLLSLILAVTTVGCVQPPAAPGDTAGAPLSEQADRYIDGTATSIGMLDFLNDPATTFDLLDQDVGLDRRAALGIIAHRDGPDGLAGTPDDNLFDTIGEVDDVYYVGPAALRDIQAYAEGLGYVPGPDDVLGTWDDVTFTVNEANATVAFTNKASASTLDDDLALDSRAVDSILAARPLTSVEQLSGLYYVGHSALTTLKDASASN